MNKPALPAPYYAIAVVWLIQSGVVVGGTLFVSAMLRAGGYGGGEIPDTFFNLPAKFVKHFGFGLLLVPVAWAWGAVFISRNDTTGGWGFRSQSFAALRW